jgi:hypothetical protein
MLLLFYLRRYLQIIKYYVRLRYIDSEKLVRFSSLRCVFQEGGTLRIN